MPIIKYVRFTRSSKIQNKYNRAMTHYSWENLQLNNLQIKIAKIINTYKLHAYTTSILGPYKLQATLNWRKQINLQIEESKIKLKKL